MSRGGGQAPSQDRVIVGTPTSRRALLTRRGARDPLYVLPQLGDWCSEASGAIAHLRVGLSSACTPPTRPATACQGPPGAAPPRSGTCSLTHTHMHVPTRLRGCTRPHRLTPTRWLGGGMTPLLGDVHRTPLGVEADVVPPSQGGAVWLEGAGWLLICTWDPENHGLERQA